MVSIITLSFNTKQLLKESLQEVRKQLRDEIFEIIVVDNASSDGSVEMVKKEFPDVVLIENEKNVGFARGCNLGAKKAKGEHILFINSDTLMIGNHLREFLADFSTDEKLAIIGGALQNNTGKMQRSWSSFYNLTNVFFMLIGGDRTEMRTRDMNKKQYVDWVSGGFMMVKKEVFDKLNGFDENFFMYIEDMELCYRIKRLGLHVLYNPTWKLRHLGQGSSSRSFAIVQIYRGLAYFYKKHKNPLSCFLLKSMLKTKAFFAIGIGIVTNNSYLQTTYRKALRF